MPRLGRRRALALLVVWTSWWLAPGIRAQSSTPAWSFAGNAGRGSGGPVIALRDSSTDSLYLLHEEDGSSLTQAFLWRSDDFGLSWISLRSSSPDTLVSLKADPLRSGAVFALHATALGELELWESDDSGRRWQVNGGPASEPYANSATLVVSSLVPDRLYVSGLGLWISEDRGTTWELLSSVARSGLVEHPTDPEVLVAVAPGVALLMRSVDGGRHWHLLSQVLEEGTLFDFAVAPSDPERVYATSSRGILRSDDGGRNWRVVRPLEPGSCLLPTVDASDPERLLLADLCSGHLLATRDGGDEWTEVSLPRRGGGWSFAVEPRDLDDLWFTNGDLRHSLDGGSTSTAVPTPVPGGEMVGFLDGGSAIYALSASGLWRPAGDGTGWHRRGELPPAGYPVAVDPHRPQTIYYTGYAALWRSLDGGRTFAQIPSRLANGIDQLIFDRHRPGRLLAATSEDAWRSDDGGVRWTSCSSAPMAVPCGGAGALRRRHPSP